MIQLLTGKYRKRVAWLLFFVFYGELTGSLYAGKKVAETLSIPHSSYDGNKFFFYGLPADTLLSAIDNKPDSLEVEPGTIALQNIVKTDLSTEEDGDIGGPGQPEMSAFKSASSDNMVNLFTGDFSYNIPLLDVAGYPVNLFYNAGITMDQEASWVGLGWNINPGTISRNMRGLPDDYNGLDSVRKVQSIRPDATVGVTASKHVELFGNPRFPGDISAGIFYNNRRGMGLEAGIHGELSIQRMLAIKGKDDHTNMDTGSVKGAAISGGIDLNSQNGMSLNAGFLIYMNNAQKLTSNGLGTSVNYSSRQGVTDIKITGEYNKYKAEGHGKDFSLQLENSSRRGFTLNFARPSYTPSIRMPMTRFNQLYSVKLGYVKKGVFKNASLNGYVVETRIAPRDTVQTKPAYGYMYYEEANNDINAMLDFNRLNDGVYTLKKPVIDLPVYTYDVFSINGEGTGGSFRGYRGNMGYMRDNFTRTKSSTFSLSVDFGNLAILHGGTTFGGIYSPGEVQEWTSDNLLRRSAKFNKSDSTYQHFYFKNPGEKAIIDEDYYQRMGEDKLVRPYLFYTNMVSPYLTSSFQSYDKDRNVEATPIPLTSSTINRVERDKRAQVITSFKAEDADRVYLDQFIYSYKENVFQPGSCYDSTLRTRIRRYNPNDPTFYRLAHHLSAVEVLEPNGMRYSYGIPVYQIKQKEVTFSSTAAPDNTTQLIEYGLNENNTLNDQGKDWLYQSESMKGYAHSFLLTSILSPDYVDVTGDGVSDDDLGTAVKFNYSRVNKQRGIAGNYWHPYKWRVPAEADKASFNEGLKTDNTDNKGMYTYGEKELWYLHSVESKNMVATFRISGRNDGKQVEDENGGVLSDSYGQRKLDRIDLFTKADYLKYGANARPIKTVHFRYSYKLCHNYVLNTNEADGRGKLTLDSVWCTFNGNEKQKKNKYVFKYGITSNPGYNSVESDRWGNYKNHLANPDDVINADFPYVVQDADSTNKYAAAWLLERILLPSGAIMDIKYEADDYAFVQNKRASQMMTIAGFGKTALSTPAKYLYTWGFIEESHPAKDHRFVFFNVTDPLENKQAIATRYLQDLKQILLKLWVKVPDDQLGGGYEPIVVYGIVKDYGLAKDGGVDNPYQFYIELETTRRGNSPIMETIMQFAKDHLPSKAYPGYDVSGRNGFAQFVRSVFGMMFSFVQGVRGFEGTLKGLGHFKEVKLSMSFARLNNPNFKKLGGGHRVKRVTIRDSWERMTRRSDETGMPESTYGQIYEYTTTEEIGGQKMTISSGVASYEPSIGNEENPFREVLKYSEKQFLGPTDHSNVELPVAETFFPTPMVGYSKITVKSIHNKSTKKIKSGVGLQQTEFYTTRDFPVFSDFTSFDAVSKMHQKPGFINEVFRFRRLDYMTLTQGFRVVLNDMNGKMKSQASYPEDDYKNPVNYTEWRYRTTAVGDKKFKLDNVLPVISGPDGVITNKLIGKEVEVMNDFREHSTRTYSVNIPVNLDLVSPLVIVPTFFRMGFHDESRYRSATTLKVVNEYGILDSVINIDKGSVVSTKNLVYDAENGNTLVSRTNNEFKDPVYQFNYPAWWGNSGMEPAYRNIDLVYTGVVFRNGKIESDHVNMNFFESGDEIYVQDMSNTGPAESIGCIGNGYPPFLPTSDEYKIWALDVRKDLRNTVKAFIFIDRYGKPYNAADATIRVIRSGKRNLTGASAGNVISLASPMRMRGGQLRIIIDDTTNVLNSSAVEFKERWRATDMFYAVDTIIRTVRQTPLNVNTLAAVETHAFGEYYTRGDRYLDNIPGPEDILAEQFNSSGGGRDFRQRSWFLFDFSGLSASATIRSATLSLKAHRVSLHDFLIHKNKDFARCPDNTPVYNTIDEHGMNNPHISTSSRNNDFILSRMFSSWPSDENCSAWSSQYHFNPPAGDYNILHKNGTPPNFSASNYSFDVTTLAKGMWKDKLDPSKNYATALRINLAREVGNNVPGRVCFWGIDPTIGETTYEYAPRLQITNYTCQLSDPIVYQGGIDGAPTTPGEGYTYCITDTAGKLCFSVFSKQRMNPYIEGVIGNFRPFRSYVYYGERRENLLEPTYIRKDGVIKDFEPFWDFDQEQLQRTYSAKWVWNSEITQYNRKGAELENHDPLNRYNAGIYGYQESLPVAVVSNSRLRLSAFDGFEDYFYKDDPCEPHCKPSKRHFDTQLSLSALDTTESHTGKYSVKIAQNTSYNIDINVLPDDTTTTPDIRVDINKTPFEEAITVNPNGIGLKGYYFDTPDFSGTATCTRTPDYPNLMFQARNNGSCKSSGALPDCAECSDMSVRWKGSIQVPVSGEYSFSGGWANDFCQIKIKVGATTYTVADGVNTGDDYEEAKTPITLVAGVLYEITVELRQLGGWGEIHLVWKQPGDTYFSPIPLKNLYPEGQESLADGTTVTQTVYCEKPDTIQAIDHHLIDSFALVPLKKMVASVWMKKGGEDCKCTGYDNAFIIKDHENNVLASFTAKERIIEGWQLFEAIFTVPETAEKIVLNLSAPADADVYIDDLRLHPYNANMKSFVYDPVTLRLAAQLDENNFAALYEYDDDGGLIRTKKETKRGIKTISETRSAVQKNIKDLED